jgi:hypothetical protein
MQGYVPVHNATCDAQVSVAEPFADPAVTALVRKTCEQRCDATLTCRGFTLDPATHECKLMSTACSAHEATARPYVSPVPVLTVGNGLPTGGCGWVGTSPDNTLDSCAAKAAESGCAYFSTNLDNNGECAIYNGSCTGVSLDVSERAPQFTLYKLAAGARGRSVAIRFYRRPESSVVAAGMVAVESMAGASHVSHFVTQNSYADGFIHARHFNDGSTQEVDTPSSAAAKSTRKGGDVPGQRRSSRYTPDPDSWTFCADAGSFCSCPRGRIRFGIASTGLWAAIKNAGEAGLQCDVTEFDDPAIGIAKACYCSKGAAAAPFASTNTESPAMRRDLLRGFEPTSASGATYFVRTRRADSVTMHEAMADGELASNDVLNDACESAFGLSDGSTTSISAQDAVARCKEGCTPLLRNVGRIMEARRKKEMAAFSKERAALAAAAKAWRTLMPGDVALTSVGLSTSSVARPMDLELMVLHPDGMEAGTVLFVAVQSIGTFHTPARAQSLHRFIVSTDLAFGARVRPMVTAEDASDSIACSVRSRAASVQDRASAARPAVVSTTGQEILVFITRSGVDACPPATASVSPWKRLLFSVKTRPDVDGEITGSNGAGPKCVFEHVATAATFAAAEAHCREHGGHLASMHSVEEVSLAQPAANAAGSWVGLHAQVPRLHLAEHDHDPRLAWQWTDGTAVGGDSLDNSGKTQLWGNVLDFNATAGSGEVCARWESAPMVPSPSSSASVHWSPGACTDLRPFTCKICAEPASSPPQHAMCPAGWRHVGKSCYWGSGASRAKTWAAAEQDCAARGRIGAHLASLSDASETAWVVNAFGLGVPRLWIGPTKHSGLGRTKHSWFGRSNHSQRRLEQREEAGRQGFVKTRRRRLALEAGRQGLVIALGPSPHGPRNGLALMSRLRHTLGSTLPAEIFFADTDEIDPAVAALLLSMGNVTLRPLPDAAGFQLKPMAMAHSSFDEVIMMDSDITPMVAPDILFDDPSYLERGNLFWPDFPCRTISGDDFFAALGVPMVSLHAHGTAPDARSHETESGAIVLNRVRHAEVVKRVLALHLKEARDTTFRAVHGDKDTWRIGFFLAGAGAAFNQVPTPPRSVLHFRNRRWEQLAVAQAWPGHKDEIFWIHRSMKENKELTPGMSCDYISPPIFQAAIQTAFEQAWDRDALRAKLPSRFPQSRIGTREPQRRACTAMLHDMAADLTTILEGKKGHSHASLPQSTPPTPTPTRVVWQTVRSRERISPQGHACMATWRDLNDESWDIRVMDDAQVDVWVATHFNASITQAFRALPLGVMRADAWRYMVLYIHGGLYADADTRCLTPIDAWWAPRRCAVVIGQENDVHFTQWTLAAAAPRHPLFAAVLEVLFRRMLEPIDTRNEHFVHHVTGPAAFTDGIKLYLQRRAHARNNKEANVPGLDLPTPGNEHANDFPSGWSVDSVMHGDASGPDAHGVCFRDIFRGKTNQGNPVVTNEFGSQYWVDGASWVQERRLLVDATQDDLRSKLRALPDVGLAVGVTHARGRWMQTKRATQHKAFVCCAASAFGDAMWKIPRNSTWASACPEDADESFGLAGHEGCSCDHDSPGTVHGREKYEWIPDAEAEESDTSSRWDADEFCRYLGERTVLFLGDSTLHQASSTLRARLRTATCGAQIQWVEADTLVGENLGWMNRGSAWLDYVREHRPSIVIMGLGPHVQPRWGFDDAMREYSRAIAKLVKQIFELRTEMPNVEVVWKTISGGHASVGKDCHSATGPLAVPPDFAGFVGTPNWRYFPAFDAVAVPALRAAGCEIVDMSPVYLRPDAHSVSDCLHFCEPGPLGLVAVEMLKLLRREANSAKPETTTAGKISPELLRLPSHLARTAASIQPANIAKTWSGRGIVLALSPTRDGQLDLLTLLHVLRHDQHCTLPVQVFYADAGEVTPSFLKVVEEFSDVTAVDASSLAPAGMSLRGFQIKAFALLHSRFAEVLLLDSDCMPARNPSLLFHDALYRANGNIFFPDYPTKLGREVVFDALGVPPPGIYRGAASTSINASAYEADSAAMLVDKIRHEAAVRMTYALNVHHKLVYSYLWGDKDTFRLGFYLAHKGDDYAQSPVASSAAFACATATSTADCHTLAMVHYAPSAPHDIVFVHRSQAMNKDYTQHVRCDVLTSRLSGTFLAANSLGRLPMSQTDIGRLVHLPRASAAMQRECTRVVTLESKVVQLFVDRVELHLTVTSARSIERYHARLQRATSLRRLLSASKIGQYNSVNTTTLQWDFHPGTTRAAYVCMEPAASLPRAGDDAPHAFDFGAVPTNATVAVDAGGATFTATFSHSWWSRRHGARPVRRRARSGVAGNSFRARGGKVVRSTARLHRVRGGPGQQPNRSPCRDKVRCDHSDDS